MTDGSTDNNSNSNTFQKKGLVRKSRKKLTKRLRKGLTQMNANEINLLSEFEVLRYSILNNYFSNIILRNKGVSVEQLRSFLVDKASRSSLKFNIPRKYRNRKVDALLGEIPFKNLLLWCSSTSDFKTAALHLCIAIPESISEDPKDRIIHLIGGPCKESNCRGKYGVWIFNNPNTEA
jgi:hypothetical protein